MSIQFLILCRGNVVRSPFISGYLNHLYRTSGIAQDANLEFISAGTEASVGQSVHPAVHAKAMEIGFDLSQHRAMHATLSLLQDADVVIVTDSKQYNRIRDYLPQFMPKTHHIWLFGRSANEEAIDIKDPGNSTEHYPFDAFFTVGVDESIRIWDYIESKYSQLKQEGKRFGPEHFVKETSQKEKGKYGKYSRLRRRFIPMCPHCQSRRLRRIRRQGFIQQSLLPLINGFPYRCGTCKRTSILFIGENAMSRKSTKMERNWKRFLEAERVTK